MNPFRPVLGIWRRLGLRPPRELITLEPLEIDEAGWLHGKGVIRVPAHATWHYPQLGTPDVLPRGVLHHYTATDPGTAERMARRRTRRRDPKVDRAASWHVTAAQDGRLWQMVSLRAGAWHCGRGTVEGVRVNLSLLGLELEGHGDVFPVAQVFAVKRFLEAVAYYYELKPSDLRYEHRVFDPKRRTDPGDLWAKEVLPNVLRDVFGDDFDDDTGAGES